MQLNDPLNQKPVYIACINKNIYPWIYHSDQRRNPAATIQRSRDHRGHTPSHNGGIAKAVSMSLLEISQLEPDHNQHHDYHHTKFVLT